MSTTPINPTLVDANDLLASQQQQITDLNTQVADLKSEIANTYQFSDLHQIPLYPADKKIPFQLIQPGNVGNTGGGSSEPHGQETIKIQGDGSALVNVAPANPYNNFFNYMVLPFPQTEPTEFTWAMDDYSGATAADWGKSQQFEFQNEIIQTGFCYNMAWAISPTAGLRYFDKKLNMSDLTKGWVQFLNGGKPVMVDLGQPTGFISTCSIDVAKKTVTYETIQVNSQIYQVGITLACPAMTGRQFSTSFQLDCNAKAQSYSAVLDGWTVKYR